MTFSNLATHMLLITLAGLAVGMPSNPLSKRVGRDCGAWTIYCGGIPQEDGSFGYSAVGACNNACHFINIYKNGEYTAVYRTDTDIKRNGFHSGCRAANSERRKYAWDVCTTMPFSQQYVHQDHSTGRAKHELTGYRFVEDINPGGTRSHLQTIMLY